MNLQDDFKEIRNKYDRSKCIGALTGLPSSLLAHESGHAGLTYLLGKSFKWFFKIKFSPLAARIGVRITDPLTEVQKFAITAAGPLASFAFPAFLLCASKLADSMKLKSFLSSAALTAAPSNLLYSIDDKISPYKGDFDIIGFPYELAIPLSVASFGFLGYYSWKNLGDSLKKEIMKTEAEAIADEYDCSYKEAFERVEKDYEKRHKAAKSFLKDYLRAEEWEPEGFGKIKYGFKSLVKRESPESVKAEELADDYCWSNVEELEELLGKKYEDFLEEVNKNKKSCYCNFT